MPKYSTILMYCILYIIMNLYSLDIVLRLTSLTRSNLRNCQMLYHWLIKYLIWNLKQITDICVTFYNFHESQLVKFVMKDVCDRYVRSVQLRRIATLDNKLEQPLISSTQEEILTKKLIFIILDEVPSQH